MRLPLCVARRGIEGSLPGRRAATLTFHLRHQVHSFSSTSRLSKMKKVTIEQNGTTETVGAHNAWIGYAGAAGTDLRSDTMTTPTASMLAAVQSCTLLDDVFMEDPTTMELEAHCAALAGKEPGCSYCLEPWATSWP